MLAYAKNRQVSHDVVDIIHCHMQTDYLCPGAVERSADGIGDLFSVVLPFVVNSFSYFRALLITKSRTDLQLNPQSVNHKKCCLFCCLLKGF